MSDELIIFIGPCCSAAALKKYFKERSESYIFDWVRSNIKIVIDVITNGKDWHIENNLDEKKCKNPETIKKYCEYYYKYLYYPHHDYKKDHDYMKRCSERFLTS